MVVRANGRSLHFNHREKLDAVGRFLKAGLVSLNPRADRAPFPDANSPIWEARSFPRSVVDGVPLAHPKSNFPIDLSSQLFEPPTLFPNRKSRVTK
jgi:hypothetical protein